MARVSVTSEPVTADISIDGAVVGQTPSSFSLDPGSHTFVLSKQGFTPWRKLVTVLPGSVITLKAEMAPEKSPSSSRTSVRPARPSIESDIYPAVSFGENRWTSVRLHNPATSPRQQVMVEGFYSIGTTVGRRSSSWLLMSARKSGFSRARITRNLLGPGRSPLHRRSRGFRRGPEGQSNRVFQPGTVTSTERDPLGQPVGLCPRQVPLLPESLRFRHHREFLPGAASCRWLQECETAIPGPCQRFDPRAGQARRPRVCDRGVERFGPVDCVVRVRRRGCDERIRRGFHHQFWRGRRQMTRAQRTGSL